MLLTTEQHLEAFSYDSANAADVQTSFDDAKAQLSEVCERLKADLSYEALRGVRRHTRRLVRILKVMETMIS